MSHSTAETTAANAWVESYLSACKTLNRCVNTFIDYLNTFKLFYDTLEPRTTLWSPKHSIGLFPLENNVAYLSGLIPIFLSL